MPGDYAYSDTPILSKFRTKLKEFFDNIYLSQTDAKETYLTKDDALATYVTKDEAEQTYLKKGDVDEILTMENLAPILLDYLKVADTFSPTDEEV